MSAPLALDLPSHLEFPRVLTVGHSNHPPEAFLRLLSKFNVKAVEDFQSPAQSTAQSTALQELVDVRSIPSSGKFPHFKRLDVSPKATKLCCSRIDLVWVATGWHQCPCMMCNDNKWEIPRLDSFAVASRVSMNHSRPMDTMAYHLRFRTKETCAGAALAAT